MQDLRELSKQLGGKIKSQNLIHLNLNEISFKRIESVEFNKFKLRINDFELFYEILISVKSPFIFSVNKTDRVLPIEKLTEMDDFGYKFYMTSSSLFNEKCVDFCSEVKPMLIDLNLSQNEMIVFYENKISLVIEKGRSILNILSGFLGFLSTYEKIIFNPSNQVRIVSNNIPIKLRVLMPILVKIAVYHDNWHEFVEKSSNLEKIGLVKKVNPLFNDINAFLDSFNDKAMSEEAIQIGKLAELASELIILGFGTE